MAFEEYRIGEDGIRVKVQVLDYHGTDLRTAGFSRGEIVTGRVSKVDWYPNGCFCPIEITLDDGRILPNHSFIVSELVRDV